MKIIYQFIEENLSDSYLGQYKSCTITASGINGEILEKISDAFINPIIARQFVDRCNICQLMPSHLKDVLIDTIA